MVTGYGLARERNVVMQTLRMSFCNAEVESAVLSHVQVRFRATAGEHRVQLIRCRGPGEWHGARHVVGTGKSTG